MNGYLRKGAGALAMAVSLAILPSCLKRGESLKSDLSEAGYELTEKDWFRASRDNDVAALKQFSAAGFSADLRDPAGDTALHGAAAAGAQDAADYLLTRRVLVDLRGAAERTPLMSAIVAGKPSMVRWLLRQGADPRAKDAEGFSPLLLAVREGSAGAVVELAAYDRENLDSALLLASLLGRVDVIDELTNFGASIHARMEDGRTPLMVAAENGHLEAVKLMVDLGASRFTVDSEGRTAAELASAAGHAEIAAVIARDPVPAELTLDSPLEIAASMEAFVDEVAGGGDQATVPNANSRPPAKSIEGEVIGTSAEAAPVTESRKLPLVMRHFQEKEIPLSVKSVVGKTATLRLTGPASREMKVEAGGTIPGTRLVVLRMERRLEDSKVSSGNRVEISAVQVRDPVTGATREWIAGIPAKAHDPVALVEDATTGRRYLAAPGQRFKGADGTDYQVSDVRPNQLIILEMATGNAQTIPLHGPRG